MSTLVRHTSVRDIATLTFDLEVTALAGDTGLRATFVYQA